VGARIHYSNSAVCVCMYAKANERERERERLSDEVHGGWISSPGTEETSPDVA